VRFFLTIILFLLIAGALMPGAALAQATDDATSPEVTVLSQTQTPNGLNTTLQINVSQDSFISSLQPNTNFGFDTQLRLGWSNGNFDAMRILIQFDIAAIPHNSVINSAQLWIFQTAVVPGGDRNMDFRAQFMQTPWSEGGVTWNNANYLGGDALPLGSVDSNTGWKSADVTSLVRTWYSGSRPNNGLIVIGDEIPANNRMRQFASRQQGSLTPYIVIDFTISCDAIAPNASVNALPAFSPGEYSVSWSGTDSAPSGCTPSGIANYDVDYRINGGGWQRWKNQTTSTTNTFKNWASNGDLVEFRARATDNAGNVQAMGNPQTNTRVDTQPPTVFVNPLPSTTGSQFFTLSWSGSDNLSGVANFDVEWRENGGDWQMLLQETTQTFFQITGAQNGVTYDFRARATDNVGNAGDWPDDPQASTTVTSGPVATVLPFNPSILGPTAPITTSFVVNWTGISGGGSPIISFDIFYQFNGGAWVLWQSFPANTTSARFPFPQLGFGDGGYGFEAIATNANGQREPQTFIADAVILVDLAGAIQPGVYLPKILGHENSVVSESAGITQK